MRNVKLLKTMTLVALCLFIGGGIGYANCDPSASTIGILCKGNRDTYGKGTSDCLACVGLGCNMYCAGDIILGVTLKSKAAVIADCKSAAAQACPVGD